MAITDQMVAAGVEAYQKLDDENRPMRPDQRKAIYVRAVLEASLISPHIACMENGDNACRGYQQLNEALEAHKTLLAESSLREGNLLNALHEIAELDKHGGYNTACHRARSAIAANKS